MSYVLIRELLYAEDCALACLSEEDPQRLMDCFARSGCSFQPDHLNQKDRGTITAKARDHSNSASSESRSEQTEGGGSVPLLRGHRFQQLLDRG